ncbi:MAG: DUF2007 domain-containing protein [Myxococcota bacterium]
MEPVYVCYDSQVAERVTKLLEDVGAETRIDDHASSSFPTNAGTEANITISVDSTHVEQAKQLLRDAITDEVIPDEGHIL